MRLGLGWGRGGGHRGQRWVQGEAKLKVIRKGRDCKRKRDLGPPRTVVQEVDVVHLFLAAGRMAGWKALFRLGAALRGWG